MAIPVTRPGKGIYQGLRTNKKPFIIGTVLVLLFFIGLYYAGQKRNRGVNRTHEAGTTVYDIDETPGSTIDYLADKPDGLAVADPDVAAANPAQDTVQSSMKASLAELIEKERRDSFELDKERRVRYESEQIKRFELAIQSDSKVTGFGSSTQDSYVPSNSDVGAQTPRMLRNTKPFTHPVERLPQSRTNLNANATSVASLTTSPQVQALLDTLGQTPRKRTDVSGSDNSGVQQAHHFINAPHRADRFHLNASIRSPVTPFELKTGTLISGAMISAANSDLPGDIIAQVTRSVFDTASGRHLLIPQGTKLIGRYDAFVALGQERLVIVWHRLVFPDAQTLDIGGMQGYDDRGLAGFTDKVNTHFLRTLGNALLISVVNAAGEELVSQAVDQENANITINLAREFSDITTSAFSDYLKSRLRIKPTLEIRAGYRFNIVVSKDISFIRPYERGFKRYASQ